MSTTSSMPKVVLSFTLIDNGETTILDYKGSQQYIQSKEVLENIAVKVSNCIKQELENNDILVKPWNIILQ